MGITEEQISELKDQFIKENSKEWWDRKYKRKAKRHKNRINKFWKSPEGEKMQKETVKN